MNKTKKMRSAYIPVLILALLCALAISCIPALALWADDAARLARPHERTRQAGTLPLSCDDIYLTRTLKKYEHRNENRNYREGELWYESMEPVTQTEQGEYLLALAKAGVFPEEWVESIYAHAPNETGKSQDTMGFINYITFEENPQVNDTPQWIWRAGITVEPQTGLATGFVLKEDADAALKPPELSAGAKAMIAYLGLDVLPDWENPAGTGFEDCAWYSPQGEVLVYLKTGYCSSEWITDEDGTDGERPMQFLCGNAVSVSPQQMQAWKEFEGSFVPVNAPEEKGENPAEEKEAAE